MKSVFLCLWLGLASIGFSQTQKATFATTVYDFSVKDIDGERFDFSSLKGKKVMIVNTASECGLTPQYKELEELYQAYKDKKFVIIAFPSNDFRHQEPGSNAQIKSFCSTRFQISFPLMEKITVTGKDMAPLYQFLTSSTKSTVKWNFQKYLIGRDGKVEQVIDPKVSPKDSKIIQWIEKQ